MDTLKRGPSEENGTRGPFIAKYPFSCTGCHQRGEAGDYARYFGGDVHHAECRPVTDAFIDRVLATDEDDPEPAYIMRGIRRPPYCHQCHCEHRGDCW